ncbi:MAG TPA: holo-ACP synthase [Candidimonas sp.]|nr:holo-ACP synthase [Candidimonas sp.]
MVETWNEQMNLQAGQGSVAGIGTDLLRLDRIRGVYARHGRRFVLRILGPEEIQKFDSRSQRDPERGIRFLATRFAAKEAFSKAIGLGMHSPMTWSRMQTLNDPSGKPRVELSEPLATWYHLRFGPAHVSITDESDTVMAFVMVETRSSPV